MPQARSELTGDMVDTSSEAWGRECEVRHMVDRMTPEQVKRFLEGTSEERGVVHVRGPVAVQHLQAEVERLIAARWRSNG